MSFYSEDPWATDAPDTDPWTDNAPADEAQSVPSTPPTHTPSKESAISSNEAKVVTTIKFGSGFDAPWAVFHSGSVQEAEETLNSAKNYLGLVAQVAKYAKTLDSGLAVPAQRSGGSQPQQRQNSTPPPGQQGKSCAHGAMTYRSGNGAKGAWAGHFCPLQKGDPNQCKPIFVKVD